MKETTKKQRQVLDYVRNELGMGRPPPSIREISSHFGFSSTKAARDHLAALEKKGYIERESGKARSIRLSERIKTDQHPTIDIPIIGHIPAGSPVNTEQYAERIMRIDFETLGFKPSAKMFGLVVHGDSMIGRGIFDGDVAIVDGERRPMDGDMVAALIDNECTLKTLVLQGGKTFLHPENPKYTDIVPVDNLLIQGVAMTIIRKLI